MDDAIALAGWSELLTKIKPFGETDLNAVLKDGAEVLGYRSARLTRGRRNLGAFGVVSDEAPTRIELPHAEAILFVDHLSTFEGGHALEALASVLELALAASDRRQAGSATPLMAPTGIRDRVTQTIDRDGFMDYLDVEFAAGPAAATVMIIGLDALDAVNETLGHDAGNTVLAMVADRLRETLRSCDVVCRLGSDVFGVFCPDMGVDMATKLIARLQAAVAEPIAIGANSLRVTSSAGVAIRARGERSITLLEHADIALQAAKNSANGEVAIYDGMIREASEDRRAMASELIDALAENQLATAFEPIVHLPKGSIVGVEAHVLWNHPERGQIDRTRFMDLAELIGRVDDVERAVIQYAISQQQDDANSVRTGCNLSATTMRDPASIEWMVERLSSATHKIIIEVGESALNTDEALVVKHLGALRAAGASIVLDDFGLGFASLRALHAFAFDGVKIHNSLLTEGGQARTNALVESIYASANSIGFDVIHTGVDSDDDLRLLMGLPQNEGSGFYAQGAAVRARVNSVPS